MLKVVSISYPYMVAGTEEMLKNGLDTELALDMLGAMALFFAGEYLYFGSIIDLIEMDE